MEIGRRLGAILGAVTVAVVLLAAPTHAQVSSTPVQHVIPQPTATTFPATATPAPNTYSYTFDGGMHAYTQLSCEMDGFDGTSIVSAFTALDQLNAKPQPANGVYLQGPSAAQTASANGQYVYALNGARFFDLSVSTIGTGSITVTCAPRYTGGLPFGFDNLDNLYVNLGGQTQNLQTTQTNTPAPAPTASPGNEITIRNDCPPVTSTVTANGGTTYSCRADTSGNQYVAVASPQPTSGTISVTDSAGTTPTGNGAVNTTVPTAGSYVAFQCPGACNASDIRIGALTSGNLYFERSADATSATTGGWVSAFAVQLGVSGEPLSNFFASANGEYQVRAAGATWIRVRASGTLTGSPVIAFSVSPASADRVDLINGAYSVYGRNGLTYPTYFDNPANTAGNAGIQGLPAYGSFTSTTPTTYITGAPGNRIIVGQMVITNPNSSAVQVNLGEGNGSCSSPTTFDTFNVNANSSLPIGAPFAWALATQSGYYLCVSLGSTASSGVTIHSSFARYPDIGQ